MRSHEPISRQAVHRVLKAWDNTRRLGDFPLSHIAIVENHRQQSGYQPTATGRGLALRETLQRALETLKPDGDPQPLEKRWRPYILISERYLNGRNPDYLIELLGIARSTFDHTQTDALESIADLLRQWEHTASNPQSPTFTEQNSPSPLPPSLPSSFIHPPFLAPPRPNFALVGRDIIFSKLKAQLLNSHNLIALSGLPGVGKTALAIALTHDPDMLEHYPDGILWAGLGTKPNLLALLGAWGTALGLTTDELARLPELETRARALHAAIGLRRMLIIVDDAWSAAEALVFKLGGPNCATLLTTRLPKVAIDFAGDNTHVLPELTDQDGQTLLAEFAPNVITSEPEASRALVHAAGGLPLALTLMGRHLRQETHSGPPRRLRVILERLQTTETRLRLTQPASPLDHQPSLSAELPLSLLTVIAISTETLDENTRETFYALSLFPPKPNSFAEESAVAVCSAVSPDPLINLDNLLDAGLAEFIPPDRYTLHPIIAEFARLELAEHPSIEKSLAQRLIHHFLNPLPDPLDLEIEAENVLAALQYGHSYQFDDEFIEGANAFCTYLESHGLYSLAEEHLTRAETIARANSRSNQLLTILNNLGRIAQRQGNYAHAETRYAEALSLSRMEPEASIRGAILQGLGLVAMSRGDFTQAEEYLQESLSVARAVNDPTVISAVLSNLGALSFNRGEYDQAGKLFEEGLNEAREAGLQQQTNALLTNLGVLHARRGDLAKAHTFFEEALHLARRMGQRSHTSYLLTNLGTLASERGELSAAIAYFQEGLNLAREMGQRDRVGHLLANLGALATDAKDFHQAQSYLDEAISLSRQIDHRQNTILALINMSGLLLAREDYAASLPYLKEAMALARQASQMGYISAIWLEYGRYYFRQARYDEAENAYQEGLTLARKMGALSNVGRALFGLARIALATDDTNKARQLGEESLQTYQKIGHYRANEVQKWLF